MTQNLGARTNGPLALSGLRAGTFVGGYQLARRLGAGGMGVVWEAVDGDGRHVAMKILHPQIAADPVARRRLDREASVLARVRDSRVARILDIETGEDPSNDAGVTFVITELVDGPTLQSEVENEGVYDLERDARDLADLAHGLVDALRAVHAAGVIHRDLKPSNVMLGAQGPVLIDFGIAQVADDSRLTQTGQVTGTPGFIPPEMLDGGEPAPDVDWYACAGVILFTLTGRAPFGSGPWQVVFRRVYSGTPELGDLEETCPALARALTCALAPSAQDRLSPDGLLAVLDEVAEGGSGEEAALAFLGPPQDQEATQEAAAPPGTQGGQGQGAAPAGTYGIPAPQQGAGTPPTPVAGVGSAAPSSQQYGYVHATSTSPAAPSQPPFATAPAPTGAQPPAAPGLPGAQPARPSIFPSGTYPPQAYPAPTQPPVAQQPPPAQPTPPASAASGALPAWAQEPSRHPGVIAALMVLLTVSGRYMAGWVILVATLLTLVAGTVGRAQDARRWARLSRGATSPGDSSRMWLAMPWYLLRSLVATLFAAGLVAAVTAVLAYVTVNIPGFMDGSAGILTFLDYEGRALLVMALWVATYLLGLWFIPWGAPTRRGGAQMVEMVASTSPLRWGLLAVLLVLALIVYGLQQAGEVPQTYLAPLWTWVP